jgi:hypothetical protein
VNQERDDKELLGRIAALPREICPERDPWPEIAARIERLDRAGRHGHPALRWRPAALAASLLLALVAGLLWNAQRQDVPAGRPAMETAELQAGTALHSMLAATEAEYQAAFREFISIGQSRPRLEPQTIESIEGSWAGLRDAEAALSAALAENPDDPFLNGRMLELRARQLGFLRQLAAMDQNNRRFRT